MRLAIFTFLLLAFAGAVSAVVGQDCPPDAFCATSGSEPVSSNSTGNENLTEPRVELDQISSSCSSRENGSVSWEDYRKMESYLPQHSLEFNGTVIASDPCQELEYNVSKEGGIYTLNIYSESSGEGCVDCLGAVKYKASFRASAEFFQIHVQHNGEEINSFAPPQKINEGRMVEQPNRGEEPDRTGFLASVLDFLKALF